MPVCVQGFGVLTGNTALLASPAIEQFSITHGVTRQQVVYRMAMQLGVSPLTGTSNRNRMKAALSAAQLQLDDAKFEALNARESSEFTSSDPVPLLICCTLFRLHGCCTLFRLCARLL